MTAGPQDRLLHRLPDDVWEDYRARLVPGDLGWVLFQSRRAPFVSHHPILLHPTDGPVIMVKYNIYEVDPDADRVFPTEEAAMRAAEEMR